MRKERDEPPRRGYGRSRSRSRSRGYGGYAARRESRSPPRRRYSRSYSRQEACVMFKMVVDKWLVIALGDVARISLAWGLRVRVRVRPYATDSCDPIIVSTIRHGDENIQI